RLHRRQDAQVSHSNRRRRPRHRGNVALRPQARTHQLPPQRRRPDFFSAAASPEFPAALDTHTPKLIFSLVPAKAGTNSNRASFGTPLPSLANKVAPPDASCLPANL